MKRLLTIVMLLLNLIGASSLWAADYTIKFTGGSAIQSTSNYFTVDGAAYGSSYTGTYNGETYTNALKVVAATDISFTTTATSTVTIVQCVSRSDDGNGPLKFNNTTLSASQLTASQANVYNEYTISDVTAGEHHIKRGDSQTGLFYVKVEEGNPTVPTADFKFMHSYRNVHYGETYEGNALVNTYNLPVTYSSSNTSAATIDPSTGEITIQNVGSIQSTTITAHFAGNETYGATDATYSLNVAPALVYTDIAVSNLRYQPGVNGISGGYMSRSVGGFDLTFGANQGVKCNNTNNFFFRTNSSGEDGVMTIALDDNNNSGSNYIKKIVFTAWGTPSLSVNSVAKTSGTLTQTGANEWTWTDFYSNDNTVTFTSQGENDESILISNIRVYTNSAPTFSKVTPVPAFNRNSDYFSTGASVNISDLTINTTPGNFLFDYTYDAGTTTLTHTPYTTNTTWPGTITGTAADGTATITASFSDSSNPFFNTVASTNVYTLTVNSAVKNTFTWDFTQGLSDIDTKLLTADATNWVKNGNLWKPNTTFTDRAIYATTNGNNNPLELTFGLKVANWTADNSSFIDASSKNIRLRKSSDDITIPDLQVGDIITIVSRTANTSDARGLIAPSNVSVTSGFTTSTEQVTNVGTVTTAGDVKLTVTDHVNIFSITVESANKPWPSLSFTDGSTVNVELPYNGDPLTYTNALTSVPTGATATYSILLDENAGGASAATINSSTGALTLHATGEVIVRATVTAGTYNSAYYCDYTLNATQGSQYAEWTYSSDSKEIDGEDRPYQGTVTFTKAGEIANGTKITDIPGLEVAFTAAGTVSNISTGNQNKYNGLALDGNGNVTFTPSVNGYLSIQGNFYTNTSLGSISITNGNHTYYPTLTELTTPLIAGTTYTLSATGYNFNLAAFTFRPAFLTPDETAEQTATFEAYSSTTQFPKLVHSSDAGVRFSGNRSVVNLSSDGGVTLVGGGTAIVRGKVISGDNALTAYYTLNANVLTLEGTNPTSGSTITTLDNNVFQFLFDQNIAIVDATKFVVLKDATDITSQCALALNTNTGELDYQKRLNVSGLTPLEAGSTYTIRLLADAVSKSGDATIKNPEFIGTFTVESTEPPLTWIYPSTTSAVRIGTSIVLQTSAKIDEHYPTNGIIGTLTYEGVDANDTDYPMTLTAVKDNNNIVFKPSKPLEPNKLYTLTVGANQVKLNNSTSMITKDKVFLFTTGTATGTAPAVSSSTPSEGATSMTYSGGTIEFVFDVNVELEPYSTIQVTPINGNESTASGTSDKLNSSGVLVAQTLTVDAENPKRISFTYNQDALKYDLYYQMVLPANTVTGPGGMPNTEDIVVNFKMQKNPNATEVTPATFYPHTWDFNKFGKTDNASSSISIIKANTNSTIDSRNNADQPIYNAKNAFVYSSLDGGKDYLCNAKSGYGFDQGNDIYIATGTGSSDIYKLPEFEGIRVSVKGASMSKRFAIRDLEQTNADGSGKYLFRMNGNTHYMTLSNVPVGKLYMKASSTALLAINSPNATFVEDANFNATTHDDNTRITNTNGTKALVLNVTEAGDVSFCVANFNCEKIAVAADTKTFKPGFAKDGKTYSTDRLPYDVRYDLLNELTSHQVKAYYVNTITNNESNNTADITGTQVASANAVKANQGILAVYQGGVAANTDVPIFKTDVNTASLDVTEDGAGETLKNMLKVIANDATTFPASETGYYNYVLSSGGSKTTGVGFYRYTGTSFSPRAAYLPIPVSYVNAGSGSSSSAKGTRLLLIDADDVTTGILEVEAEAAPRNNDGYYYNLNGMRVEQPKAGIYIHNGKKVIIK